MGALLGAPMDLDAYDFDLPDDRIALRPAQPRDAARLLHVNGDALADRFVRDLPSLLNPGDVLVVNDTRVTPAALKGQRPPRAVKAGETPGAGAAIDVNLIRREEPGVWTALARPGKRLRVGDIIVFADGVEARVVSKQDAGAGGEVRLAFNASGAELDAAISAIGFAPLPPYIARRRPADARDRADYQTLFAREEGAVAAPTAGLHFTPALLAALDARGVSRVPVTLHVGDGTFAPLDAAALSSGRLHAERCVLTAQAADALNSARAAGGRIVATGTTSLRTLETAAGKDRRFRAFDGETDIFIRPGYVFKGVDVLMTNFHLPRSSLFMLVAAFAGTTAMQKAYNHAVNVGYRFYSYGDATLLHNQTVTSTAACK